MPLATGQILNTRYRIVKLLGQGGFGAVYRAWDTNLDEPVALKESFETSAAAQKQFQLEAKLLFKLRHTYLPRVHDFFVVPGQGMYLVMDFIEGEDLESKLLKARQPLPEAQVLGWMAQVCSALEYLHAQNPPVIHRDIKPANIKITPEGQAMLVDFGIAKVFDANLRTTVGARAVTPGYSPQEQYGLGATDARSDVYALGATLYHLLTGEAPPESIQRNLGVQLPAPRALNPALTERTAAALLKALAMLPGERYASIKDFQTALAAPHTAIISTPIPATQVAPYQPSPTAPTPAEGAEGFRPGFRPGLTPGAPQPPAGRTPSAAGAGRIPSTPTGFGISRGWMAAGLVILAVGVLLVGGLLRALGNWRDSLSVITAAAGTQARMTELAAGSEATLPATPGAAPSEAPPATQIPQPTDTARPIATHTPTGLPPSITDDKGVVMNLIPAGIFRMGSESGDSDESPVHEVYLDAFYIDVYEVTNELYAACVRAGVCSAPGSSKSYSRDSYYGNAQYAQYPVIYVGWDDAVKFCKWRGARLPTEAEWEKAARGGLEGKQYPWGDEAPVCTKGAKNGAQFTDCSPRDTAQVGSFAANGYGLYDMAGNVWEWVQDWYDSSYYGSQTTWNNPRGPSSGQSKVLRGGSWDFIRYYLRSANRDLLSG